MTKTFPVAALPMYDWPEVRSATDSLWMSIRTRLNGRGTGTIPEFLTRTWPEMDIWTAPELLLAQSCGLPYVLDLRTRVTLVGTPAYDLECEGGSYFSVIVVRKDTGITDLSDIGRMCFAYNSIRSQSGFAAFGHALTTTVSPDARPERYQWTGSHRQSARAVAGGSADIASIDAVSWQLALRHEPATAALEVIARTDPTPGLPLISAFSQDKAEIIGQAIDDAIADLAPEMRDSLRLKGLFRSSPDDYDVIADRYSDLSTTPFYTAVQPAHP